MICNIIPECMKRFRKQEIFAPADVKIPSRLGGGTLKELVIRDLPSKKIVHYALAYINPLIFNGDNGRVLGYDNSHGYAHRHYMGSIVPTPLIGYDELYVRFEREWREIATKFVNGVQI